MIFAKKLSEARKAKSMTRKELADKVMRSQSAIKSWELGRHVPPENIQRKIEQILELPSGALSVDYDQGASDIMLRLNLAVTTLEGMEKKKVLVLLESLIDILEE